jgi:hypothetical protein
LYEVDAVESRRQAVYGGFHQPGRELRGTPAHVEQQAEPGRIANGADRKDGDAEADRLCRRQILVDENSCREYRQRDDGNPEFLPEGRAVHENIGKPDILYKAFAMKVGAPEPEIRKAAEEEGRGPQIRGTRAMAGNSQIRARRLNRRSRKNPATGRAR